MGRTFTRRPFADRVRNRRVTDDFVSAALSAALWGGYPKAPMRERRVNGKEAFVQEAPGGAIAIVQCEDVRRRRLMNRSPHTNRKQTEADAIRAL